jgi:cyclic pyranopterin phosphate synthase
VARETGPPPALGKAGRAAVAIVADPAAVRSRRARNRADGEEMIASPLLSAPSSPPETRLVDAFGRRLTYLRVSVTDRCNLRCAYCLPEGSDLLFGKRDFLSPAEIETMVGALVRLGIRRVRLTGGEPLVRRDLLEIVRRLRALPGLDDLALSTNGTELERMARPLREAGIDRVNISLDSVDPERFHAITRGDLEQVWRGVEAALEAGLHPVKLNAVLLAQSNLEDVDRLAALTLDRPLSVRFIEMMPTASNKHLQPAQYLSCDAVRGRLEDRYGALVPEDETAPRTGPAKAFRLPGAAGTVGFITPLSHTFCAECNRLRLTARGELRLCLFADRVHPLRPLLETADPGAALEEEILRVLASKPAEHGLARGDYGNLVSFMQIGG